MTMHATNPHFSQRAWVGLLVAVSFACSEGGSVPAKGVRTIIEGLQSQGVTPSLAVDTLTDSLRKGGLMIGLCGNAVRSGRVIRVSVNDGSVSWSADAVRPNAQFGRSLALVGDADGDGVGDLVVGQPEFLGPGIVPRFSQLAIVSGRSGARIATEQTGVDNDGMGYSIRLAGDVDGDGFSDILVGAPTRYREPIQSGAIDVRSGRTLKLIRELRINEPNNMGFNFISVQDVDGKGIRDIVTTGFGAGEIVCVSAESGALLWRTEFGCRSIELIHDSLVTPVGRSEFVVRVSDCRDSSLREGGFIAVASATGAVGPTLGIGEACARVSGEGTSDGYLFADAASGISWVASNEGVSHRVDSKELRELLKRQDRIIGLHWLGDVDLDGWWDVLIVGSRFDSSAKSRDWESAVVAISLFSIPAPGVR